MINVGIIGFGKMGKIREKALIGDGRVRVTSIYEYNTPADLKNYTNASNAEQVINDSNIDAVFICTPNYLNKSLTIKALEANKHVFCEKPPALNVHEVKEIIGAEKKSNKKLMYGFNHRHHASVKHIKSLVDMGDYGEVLWMRGRYGKSVDENFFHNWRANKELAGGGILLDQGIHMLDLFIYIGGNFDDVHAFVSNLYWKLDIEDNVFAILRNKKSGVVASLHSTMTQWRHLFSFEVFLEKGYMVLNGLKTSSQTYGDEVLTIAKNRTTAPAASWEDEERIIYHSDTSWESEINYFISAIIKDTPIEIGNSSDALRLMLLIEKIYGSE